MAPALIAPLPDGTIPANAGRVVLHARKAFDFKSYDVKIKDTADGKVLASRRVDVAGATGIALDQPLQSGHIYSIETSAQCADTTPPPRTYAFTAAAETPVPTSLGALRLVHNGAMKIAVPTDGLCTALVDATGVDLALDLNSSATAWKGAISQLELLVDGQPFQWQLSANDTLPYYGGGHGEDEPRGYFLSAPTTTFRAFTYCDAQGGYVFEPLPQGIEPGKHTFKVRARLSTNEDATIESAPFDVELKCPNGRGTGTPSLAEDDGYAPSSRSTNDGGTDESASAAQDGCNASSRSMQHSFGWLLTLCAALIARRRKLVRQ